MSTVDFNLSHHGDFVSLATCSHGQIGINVTKVELLSSDKTPDDFFAWYQDEFSTEEWETIHHQAINSPLESPHYLKLNRFMELWCLKEALLKGLGMGLQLPLNKVAFDLGNKPALANMGSIWWDTKLSIHKLEPAPAYGLEAPFTHWEFFETYLDPNHRCAVAFRLFKPTTDLRAHVARKFKRWDL